MSNALNKNGTYERRALVKRGSGLSEETLMRYLPSNYEIIRQLTPNSFEIGGRDVAGWTLDDYVIPRLFSGGMGAEEILS